MNAHAIKPHQVHTGHVIVLADQRHRSRKHILLLKAPKGHNRPDFV